MVNLCLLFIENYKDFMMGLFDFIKSLFVKPKIWENRGEYSNKWDIQELAKRLDVSIEQLQNLKPTYHKFSIPKRNSGHRNISSPNQELKEVQRKILRRLLSCLKSHSNVTGFEKGHSIVTNALVHTNCDVVLRMDIKNFFPSTSADRVRKYFRRIGWNEEATNLLTKLCTFGGSLPQGAPTSPRLSNLLNYQMDARLEGLAQKVGAAYTRYADDMTFSIDKQNAKILEKLSNQNYSKWERTAIALIINSTKKIIADYGYHLHQKRKLQIRRRHQCQKVTGLIVNQGVNLPRKTRRLLRSVEHKLATGGNATLTPKQLEGWRALAQMIESQSQQS